MGDAPAKKPSLTARSLVWTLSAIAGCLAVLAMGMVLPEDTALAAILLDKRTDGAFPWSIQSATWVVFFLGLGFVIQRWVETRREAAWLRAGLLPADPSVVLQKADLGAIYRRSRTIALPQGFMTRMVRRVIQQVQVSNSVEMATTLLNSSLEMFQYEIDLRFNIIRYLMWLIPTLGFIGTVIGIADALNYVGSVGDGRVDMVPLTSQAGRRLLHHAAGADAAGRVGFSGPYRSGIRGIDAAGNRAILSR